jgi:hypothetical protein
MAPLYLDCSAEDENEIFNWQKLRQRCREIDLTFTVKKEQTLETHSAARVLVLFV